MNVMVLAAGLGTRLRPLTERCAKPLVPVGDRPAVAHVLDRLPRASFPTRVINVHHRPDDLVAWAKAHDVAVSAEVELLGTAGGVAKARGLLGAGDVLVWNADILAELDAVALAGAHTRGRALATLAVRPREKGEGNVGLAEDGRVVRLRRESFGDEARGGEFLGIHVLGEALRARLPERGCLVSDLYLPALARGDRLDASVVDVAFSDVGTLADYVAANRAWLDRRGLREWAAPDSVHDAIIEGSIVGARACVRAPVRRCIVWPDAVVHEPIEDAVVTPDVVVRYAPPR